MVEGYRGSARRDRTAKSAAGWAESFFDSSPEDLFEVATQGTDLVADRDTVGLLRRVAICASGVI